MIDRNDPYFWSDLLDTILKGAGETFYTVGLSLLFTVLFGLAAGVLLVTTESGGLLAKLFGSRALGFVRQPGAGRRGEHRQVRPVHHPHDPAHSVHPTAGRILYRADRGHCPA